MMESNLYSLIDGILTLEQNVKALSSLIWGSLKPCPKYQNNLTYPGEAGESDSETAISYYKSKCFIEFRARRDVSELFM